MESSDESSSSNIRFTFSKDYIISSVCLDYVVELAESENFALIDDDNYYANGPTISLQLMLARELT